MFPDERLNHAFSEVAARPGGTPAFSGQPLDHGAMRMPLATQLGEATNQSLIVADLGPLANRSADLRLSPDASGPVAVHRHRFGHSHHRDDDALQQQSHQFLAIGRRRRGSPPKGRDILGQTPNGLLLHSVWADRLARLELLVLGLQGLSVTCVPKVPIWKALDFNGLRQSCWDRREVGGVALMEYDGPGVSATGDQEWGGYCAWWRSRGRWVALTCWRSTAPATLTTLRILACACRMASSS